MFSPGNTLTVGSLSGIFAHCVSFDSAGETAFSAGFVAG